MTYTATNKRPQLWMCFLGVMVAAAGLAQPSSFQAPAGGKGADPKPADARLLPTVVHSVRAYQADGQTVIEWRTGSPAATIGFQVHRLNAAGRPKPIHEGWVAPPWSALAGATYRVVDRMSAGGHGRRYVIVERDENAEHHVHGPFDLRIEPLADGPAPLRQTETVAHEPVGRRAAGAITNVSGPRDGDVIPTDLPQTVAKAFVRSSGLHRVTSAELAAALNQTVRKVETFMSRGQIAIENQGSSVGWFANAANTELRFYATAIDSRYTRDNVYWIVLGRPATLAGTMTTSAAGAAPGGFFQSSARAEEDVIPAINATKFEGVDFWYWDGVRAEDPAQNRKSFPLASPGVATAGGQAQMTVRLAGATKGTGYRYHNALIFVNGTQVGSVLWLGLYAVDHTVNFDAALLAEQNTVEIQGTLVPGAIGSAFFVDSFDLEYPRYYQASEGALALRGEANPVVTVDGLAGPDVLVLDLADPNQPVRVEGGVVEAAGAGYRVTFVPEAPEDLHLVTTASDLLAVDRLEADTFYSDPWQSTAGHDYVVIVPQALRAPAARLMQHRQAQGLDPYLLVLEDLYDYFSSGIADPWAVRDFLAWTTTNWAVAPRYVFLVGKGSFDPKDYQGHGDNLITPVMVATPYGMAASDNMLADIDGDRVPDFSIGRLPVLSSGEFDAYVDKVIAFEQASGAWLDEALMLADDPDQSGDFTTLSNQAIAHLPAGMTASTVYLQDMNVTAARATMFSALAQGKRIVNYIGHGGVDVFASESLLSSGDAGNLENAGTSAMVSALSCVVGQFEIPGWDALSESLLGVADGGAVTMWAPTSPSYSGAAQGLNHLYFDALGLPGARVGDAVLSAIQASAPGSASFLLETYTLLGDPATRVH